MSASKRPRTDDDEPVVSQSRLLTELRNQSDQIRTLLQSNEALIDQLGTMAAPLSAAHVIDELWNTISCSKYMSAKLTRADHHNLHSVARRLVSPNPGECSISMALFDPSSVLKDTSHIVCHGCYAEYKGQMIDTEVCAHCFRRVSDIRTIVRLIIKSHTKDLSRDEELELFSTVSRVGQWQKVMSVHR